ncbi:MAG TPA: phosphate ABC transporter permease PstA [Acidimicrobiales bacterium]|nr:phosphate ABC transporter permease PstA [Acidimicrobiales bacterium]
MSALAVPDFTLDPRALERRRLVQDTAARTLSRRHLTGRVMRLICLVALIATLIPLGLMVGYTTYRGVGALSWSFLTSLPAPAGIPGVTGGISNALVGTLIIDGLALAMAIPVGLLVALFLVGRTGRLAAALRFGADILTGLPTILIGLFVFAIVVEPLHHFAALWASMALAVIMLPIMIRANEEALRTVPEDLWEAGMALGAQRSRVVRSVVVRTALPGLVTGNLLALSRAVGETAPLLFTISVFSYTMNFSPLSPMNSLPYTIYLDSQSAFRGLQSQAWGAAFVLVVLVLVLAVVGRVVAGRLTRRAQI